MKNILLFGAGKSATYLIDYLISNSSIENWHITIADSNKDLIESKTNKANCTTAVALQVEDDATRQRLIQETDIVISLLPPALHIIVATDCLLFGKSLLTASYADEAMKALAAEAAQKGLLFLCEMGLDPGIDHMSAMQLIDNIHTQGGKIVSFMSHCGGLVAAQSDTNPWRYKISWNPRNVVMAGKAGALYKLNGHAIQEQYDELFEHEEMIEVGEIGHLSWYPNRDSLSYMPVYGLQDCPTFIRTTLRYPEFCFGWRNIIELKLTDEEQFYETDGLSIAAFFTQHFANNGFADWISSKLSNNLSSVRNLLEKTMKLIEAEEELKTEVAESGDDINIDDVGNFMMIDDEGELKDINLQEVKLEAATSVAAKLYMNNLLMKQLFFLGMDDDETKINLGRCNTASVLQFILEKKLPLETTDKDMVVMVHELEYELDGIMQKTSSTLILEGENNQRTAMAKTVGLPLGIATKLILNKTIQLTGLHIPVLKEIYEPVLQELVEEGIYFEEKTEVR
jgi:saccharopine dehydrogenase-like NADP-dependent oxidoreductase